MIILALFHLLKLFKIKYKTQVPENGRLFENNPNSIKEIYGYSLVGTANQKQDRECLTESQHSFYVLFWSPKLSNVLHFLYFGVYTYQFGFCFITS